VITWSGCPELQQIYKDFDARVNYTIAKSFTT